MVIDLSTIDGTDPAPDGTTAVVTATGVGSITGQTCDTPGTTDGACTVTVNADESGPGTVTVNAVSFSYEGQDFTVDFTDNDTAGEAATQDRDATKTWRAYRVSIVPDGLDLVRNEQSSTVTIEQTDVANPTEADWSPVPEGTTATVANASGVGTVVPNAGTCDTTGTDANGECETIANSSVAGTGTFEVTDITVEHPATGSPTTVVAGDGLSTTDTVDKTWVAVRSTITTDAVNFTGDEHLFDVTTEYTADGSTWAPVPDGTEVVVSAAGIGSIIDRTDFDTTCETGIAGDGEGTTDGVCTVWVDSEVAGSLDVSVDSVSATITAAGLTDSFVVIYGRDGNNVPNPGLLDGFDGTNRSGDGDDYASTKTWTGFGATIKPDARNQVGEPHTFTVDVLRFDGSGTPVGVPDGTVVDVQLDWAPTDASNDLVENTCATAGTVDDQCTITVNTGVGGTVTATVLGLLDFTIDGTTKDVTFDAQPSAVKTWYEYRAWVEPDAVNLVGDPHTFYVTAEQNSGDGWEPVPAGTIVGVTSTGLDAIDTDGCAAGTGDDPRTDGTTETNVCTVIVNSGTPGSIEVTVETVSADAAVDSALGDATVSQDDLEQGDSTSATKTWVEYFADIEPDEVALTGTTLTYYVTVTQDDGTGATPVPVGTQVEVSDDNPDITPTGGTCVDGTGTGDDPRTVGTIETNVCTIDVVSGTPDLVTTSVDAVQALAVDATGATTASYDDGNLSTAPGGSRTATKEWIEIAVEVTPDATNIVGEAHTFDVVIDLSTIDGTDPAPDGTTAVVTSTGVGGIIGQTCSTGTTDGACTVTVNADESGPGTVTVDAVSFSYEGQDFTVDFTDASDAGEAATQDRDATKTWRAYRVSIVPDGLDLVRNEQSSTVTIEQTDVANPTEADWSPVPEGTTATVANASGVGATIPGAGTCDTTGTNAAGECETIANSSVAGTGTFEVTDITVEHPATGSPTTVVAGDGLSTTDTVDKTWVAVRSTITTDAVNFTGDEHLFDVTTEYTADGSTWAPVPDGTEVVVSAAGIGSIIDRDSFDTTCRAGVTNDGEGTTDGVCTVWVDSEVAGSLDVSVDSVSATITAAGLTDSFVVIYGRDGNNVPNPGLLDGFDGTNRSGDGDDYASTKTWTGFGATIKPDARNKVGEPHTFTVDVFRFDGSGTPVGVPDGTLVDLQIDWTPTDASNEVVENTCATAGTVDDQCTITVNTGVGGAVEVTVLGLLDFTIDGTTKDVTFDNQPSAVKSWYQYRAWVEPDAVNLVGDPHTFYVTAEQNSDSGWEPVPAGTIVGVTSTGLDAIDTNGCAAGTGDDPRTQAIETNVCTVIVNSGTIGSIEVTVETVAADAAVDSPGPATVSQDDLEQGDSTSATKTWVEYFADIEPDEVALTGTTLTYYVTVTQDDGTGATPVPAGTQVEVSDDNPDITPTGGTCVDGTGTGDDPRTDGITETNVCTIDVVSDTPDLVTTSVDAVQALAVDATGATTASYDDGNLSTAPGGSRTATKEWVDVAVEVTPDATNIVGEAHTFDVQVHVTTPNGVATPDGTTVVVASTGVGSITGQTCDTPGTTDGACTVTVNADESGPGTVTVDAVSFSYEGQDFTVDFTDNDTAGEAATQDRDATKTWRAYRVSIVPDGLDLVRNEQSSTVTIEQTDVANPTEADWSPVPEGTTATVANASGVGATIPGAGTCDTTGTNAAGECETIANSSVVGTGTFEVTDITVAHPATGNPTTVAQGDAFTSGTVDKTWIAFRSTITPDAVNRVGDEHLFEVSTEYTVDGSTWSPVPDGSNVEVSGSGVGEFIDSAGFDTTCTAGVAGDGEGTTGGDCAVWVVSDTAGEFTVTVDSLTATISAGQLSDAFVVAYGRDTNGDPNPGLLEGFDQTDRSGDGDDYASTKTWASYRLRLNPPEAINLLDGSDDDPEKQHEITAILTSDDAVNAPVGGQTIDLAVDSGATFADGSSATTCTTADDGTCTVVITSDGPSRATVTGSYDASVGDSAPVTIASDNDAVKTWTTFRVTVTPKEALNVVGSPHVFTVKVEQSSPAADCGDDWCAVEDATPTIQVSGTDLDVDASDCDAGTDAAGECDVVVTSATVQAITLTATYTESYDGYDTEISGTASAAFSDSGDKGWVDFSIDVDPPTDENLVDTDHVFTVTITTTFPTASGEQTDPWSGSCLRSLWTAWARSLTTAVMPALTPMVSVR